MAEHLPSLGVAALNLIAAIIIWAFNSSTKSAILLSQKENQAVLERVRDSLIIKIEEVRSEMARDFVREPVCKAREEARIQWQSGAENEMKSLRHRLQEVESEIHRLQSTQAELQKAMDVLESRVNEHHEQPHAFSRGKA